MAIVEDEVRNDSEEENEIEVVVEEDDGDRDSDDSEDDDDDEVQERKVAELEQRIAEYPYNYDDHIELIQALWRLSELDRWRSAFERLQLLSALQPEHWLLRLQTEVTLAHSAQARDNIADLFHQATLDCYSIPILTEWCTWSLSSGDTAVARAQMEEVLRRAGADPLSGKIFWDAKLELEKAHLDTISQDDPEYKVQQGRVLWCLEETVSRPLLRCDEAWQQTLDLALALHNQQYVDKVKYQHDSALDYLQKITPYEDKLLTVENQEEKCKLYQEYIDTVKEMSNDKKYAECDSNGILKVLYERATTECIACSLAHSLLVAFACHARACSSRATYARVLAACTRRCPRKHTFWSLQMHHAQREGAQHEQVKTIFETALAKGMESYKDAESLWLSYLEFVRRETHFDNEQEVEKLRQTFRLAWDSLAEAWGDEANDCEVPLFWARLEYNRMNDPKQGKEIFEEIFKYGENKAMSKYWETFIQLECSRSPPLSENKRRDLYRRALKFVGDYPPSVARLWTDYERDYGRLDSARECYDTCEAKLKEWRDSYQAMKDKMIGKKQKGKQSDKKSKFDKKKKKKDEEQPKSKTKRKADEDAEGTESKRKRDADMEVEESASETQAHGSGVKRPLEGDNSKETENKRQKTDDAKEDRLGSRDDCTLFVSNLEFKVDEQKLRDNLSQYGDIVSLRVRSGVKAFGGSICYCQYKTLDAVDEALKHDRTPLEGRPMFFSRYSAKKGKASFKYSTAPEKNKLFVKNLPFSHCTKDKLSEVFDKHGKLKDVRIVTHKDGRPKGLAYVEYEDEASAATAIEKTDGLLLGERTISVAVSAPPPKDESATTATLGLPKRETGKGMAIEKTDGLLLGERTISVAVSAPPPKDESAATATLGLPKRETGKGMRRTQLSSFIPRVLQTPSTSSANGGHSGASGSKLSNTDFRQLLLKK